jgi:hypothetical protein
VGDWAWAIISGPLHRQPGQGSRISESAHARLEEGEGSVFCRQKSAFFETIQ